MSAPGERAKAKERGDRHYFTGRPCPKGHISERFTSTGQCCECMHEIAASQEKKRYDKHYYEKNKDYVLERSRAYYEANRDRTMQNVKEWGERNAEKVHLIKRAYKHRRRAKKKGGASYKEVQDWISAQPKECYWCGVDCQNQFHIDHYIPLSRGGEHETGNLVIACPDCNQRKSAKCPYEFAQSLGRLF